YGKRACPALFACLALAGCGGSGYDSSTQDVPDPGPQGYYAGSMAADADGFAVRAVALVDGAGHVRIVDTVLGRQFIVSLPATRAEWSSTVQGYAGSLTPLPGGGKRCSGTLKGSGYDA